MRYTPSLACLLFFWLSSSLFQAVAASPYIQSNDSLSYNAAKEGSVVRSVSFRGNFNINETTLEGLVQTRTNREFFEIPRLTLRYFIWKINPKWGEAPKTLKRAVVSRDMEIIQLYYRSLGFFESTVDTQLVDLGKNRARVIFDISEGPASAIDTVFYRGIPDSLLKTGLMRDFIEGSELKKNVLSDTSYISSRRYREDLIDLEYNRLNAFLKNNGYAAVRQDSINVLVRQLESKLNRDLLFDVKPGTPYRFGDVIIRLNEANARTFREERIIRDTSRVLPPQELILQKNDAGQIKYNTIADQLQFKPGASYDQESFDRSLVRLQQLGIFSVLGSGTGNPNTAHQFDSLHVPMYIHLQSLPKHSISTEWFGMRRFGFGTGSNITYTNNNLRGGAERLQVSFNGSFEYLTDNSINRLQGITDSVSSRLIDSRFLRSLETSVTYSLPKLSFPFSLTPWKDNALSTRTEYAVTHSVANQIFFDINLELRLNWRFEVQHSRSRTSLIDLLELEWLDTTPQAAYLEQLQRIYEDPILVSFAREDFRPQFTSIIRYRYRHSTTNSIKRDQGQFNEYSLAVAGNIPYFLDRYVITPNQVESNLPSLGFSGNRIDYAQFVKMTADWRRYRHMDPEGESVWANRLFVGLIHPYGKNTDIPINRRFFAGGNNDIRSYNVFRLGPGALSTQEIPRNGGEVKLMLQSEIRQLFIRNFLSADWHSVLFAETGNVWYGFRELDLPAEQRAIVERGRFRPDTFIQQLPVVGGFGVRLDWDFVILRMDLAFRFRDVQDGWFSNNTAFFVFGIGHTF